MSYSRGLRITAILLASLPAPRVVAQQAATPPYTKAQAAEGKEAYARHCASCHGARLDGTLASPLVGEAFLANWYVGDRTAADLLAIIAETMPLTAPGSLSAEQYAALTAYVFAENGHAPTGEPLVAGAEALDAILVAPRKAGGKDPSDKDREDGT